MRTRAAFGDPLRKGKGWKNGNSNYRMNKCDGFKGTGKKEGK